MIASKDVNPENDIYYLGSLLIDVLASLDSIEVDYIVLFHLFNQKQKISLCMFTLVLDWLFLLGVIDCTDKGDVFKCF